MVSCYGFVAWCFIWFADEWNNFLERIGRGELSEDDFKESPSDMLELRFWVSYRGQTLARTGQFVCFISFVCNINDKVAMEFISNQYV